MTNKKKFAMMFTNFSILHCSTFILALILVQILVKLTVLLVLIETLKDIVNNFNSHFVMTKTR
jgi:hypothetical protein